MKKNFGTSILASGIRAATVLMALCAITSVSRANLYLLSFTGTGANVGSGQINVTGGIAQSGSLTFTSGDANSATYGTWNLVGGGSSGTAGGFDYDNSVNTTVGADPFLTSSGLVFTSTVGGWDINLYSNGPGSYELLGNINGLSFSPTSSGTATLAAVPEPVNYALAAFCMVFIGGNIGRIFSFRRRSAMA
jgi:hypothetical protein